MSDAHQQPASRPHKVPYPAPAVGWYATILLAFLYWLSILDRFVISLLVDPIKHDLQISDLQFGMLHGFAFAITFSVFGLLAGSLADRFNRRWIIFASVSIWSLATTACGLAQSFWHLMLARVGVGAGEAGLNPCATSMISDLFPRENLTSAMAVYAIGASLGSGCAYLFGGMIVELVSQIDVLTLPIIGEIRSWQAVFFIVGIPGLLLSFLVFTIPEPVRRGKRAGNVTGNLWHTTLAAYIELIKFMRVRWRYYLFHYAGFAVASIIVVGAGAWYPAHMGRSFGWEASQIGLGLGLVLVIGGATGKIICGYFVDLMFRQGFRDAQLRWYACSLLAALPIGLLATTSGSPWVFLICIGIFIGLLSPLPACSSAALNMVTPNELRGTGIAFFSSSAGLIGLSLGPILIAGASDYIFGGEAIGYGIATLIAICCPLGAVLLFCGLRGMRDAMAEAETWDSD